jgi:HPt (histidine-containing phosphotransfer) domain-containing protein
MTVKMQRREGEGMGAIGDTTIGDIIDVDVLWRNLCGDRDLLSELTNVFQQQLALIQAALVKARATADGPAVAKAAHKLKGSLLTLGARCAATAEQLELEARNGFGSAVRDLSAELDLKVAKVAPALRTLLEKHEL